MSSIDYRTITTRIYTNQDTDQGNANRLAYRTEDLVSYGRLGYSLLSTITIPEHDWTTIIDTLALTD